MVVYTRAHSSDVPRTCGFEPKPLSAKQQKYVKACMTALQAAVATVSLPPSAVGPCKSDFDAKASSRSADASLCAPPSSADEASLADNAPKQMLQPLCTGAKPKLASNPNFKPTLGSAGVALPSSMPAHDKERCPTTMPSDPPIVAAATQDKTAIADGAEKSAAVLSVLCFKPPQEPVTTSTPSLPCPIDIMMNRWSMAQLSSSPEMPSQVLLSLSPKHATSPLSPPCCRLSCNLASRPCDAHTPSSPGVAKSCTAAPAMGPTPVSSAELLQGTGPVALPVASSVSPPSSPTRASIRALFEEFGAPSDSSLPSPTSPTTSATIPTPLPPTRKPLLASVSADVALQPAGAETGAAAAENVNAAGNDTDEANQHRPASATHAPASSLRCGSSRDRCAPGASAGTPARSPRTTCVGSDPAPRGGARAARVLPCLQPSVATPADVVRDLARKHALLNPHGSKYWTLSTEDCARMGTQHSAGSQLLMLDRRNLFRYIGPYTVTSSNIALLSAALDEFRGASAAFDRCSQAFEEHLHATRVTMRQGKDIALARLTVLYQQSAEAFCLLGVEQSSMAAALSAVIAERATPEFHVTPPAAYEEQESANNAGLRWLNDLVSECMRNTGDVDVTWSSLATYVVTHASEPLSDAASAALDMFAGSKNFKPNFANWVRLFAAGRSPSSLAMCVQPTA